MPFYRRNFAGSGFDHGAFRNHDRYGRDFNGGGLIGLQAAPHKLGLKLGDDCLLSASHTASAIEARERAHHIR